MTRVEGRTSRRGPVFLPLLYLLLLGFGMSFFGLAPVFAADPSAIPGVVPGPSTGTPTAPGMSPFQFILGSVQFFLIGFFIYFFMAIRPQQLRDEERKKFVGELKKNDEVITSGGIFAKVVSLKDDSVTVDIGAGVKLRVHVDHVSPPPPIREPAVEPSKNVAPAHKTTES